MNNWHSKLKEVWLLPFDVKTLYIPFMEKLLLDNVNVGILPCAEVPRDLDIVCYVITARSMGYMSLSIGYLIIED